MAGQQESKMPCGPDVTLFDNYMDETRRNNIPILEILNKKTQNLNCPKVDLVCKFTVQNAC